MPPKKKAEPPGNAVYRISVRWTISKFLIEDNPDEYSVDWAIKQADEKYRPILEEALFSEGMAKRWIFQLEWTQGETHAIGNWHFQGTCNLVDKIRVKQLAMALNNDCRGIEISPACNGDKMALSRYCMKKDSRMAGPWADREIYMGEDLPATLKGWQGELEGMLAGNPDDRTIMWICDFEGGHGKSKFCKYMAFHHGAVKLTYGKAGDLLNLVSKHPNKKTYFFDLTRSKPAEAAASDLYAAMESIQDGHFCNLKYETEIVLMRPCHCVVFANHWPHFEALTLNRWKLFRIVALDKPLAKCAVAEARAGQMTGAKRARGAATQT